MEKHNKESDSKPFILRTPLAKQLWELRQEVLASGIPLLALEEIRRELRGVDTLVPSSPEPPKLPPPGYFSVSV